MEQFCKSKENSHLEDKSIWAAVLILVSFVNYQEHDACEKCQCKENENCNLQKNYNSIILSRSHSVAIGPQIHVVCREIMLSNLPLTACAEMTDCQTEHPLIKINNEKNMRKNTTSHISLHLEAAISLE